MDLAQLRHEYMRAGLAEADADPDPFRQFGHWMQAAIDSGVALPNAMTLATATRDGRPTARQVLLKGFDGRGFVFYTNYQSRKARELEANPRACLLFCWEELERQVRIEGAVSRTSAEESDEYYATRPVGSRLGAWASPQSDTVPDRAHLEWRMRDMEAKHGLTPPRPPFWGGYRVRADYFEFWQGRKDRLHDRLAYRQGADGGWSVVRLGP